MSPRTGRPPKAEASRNVSLNIRLTEAEAKEIKECAEKLGVSRTDAIMQGIHLILGKERKGAHTLSCKDGVRSGARRSPCR